MCSYYKLIVFVAIFICLSVITCLARAHNNNGKIITGNSNNIEEQHSKETKDKILEKYVQHLSQEGQRILSDSSLSENEKKKQVTELMNKTLNFEWMGLYSLGRYRNKFTKEEIERFIKIYSLYLIKNYTELIKKAENAKVNILGTRKIDEKQYIVFTQTFTKDSQTPIKIDYLVQLIANDEFRVGDVITENFSLLKTQQEEFTNILLNNNGNIENLISILEKKGAN